MPVEDVLRVVDDAAAQMSRVAVEFSQRLEGAGEGELPCMYQWHKLEKAAKKLLEAREIEHETLAQVSVANAEKELISRAVALMDCLNVTGGSKDETAPNLRQPGRRTRKHPWGQSAVDE